jgi:hypothetical protein
MRPWTGVGFKIGTKIGNYRGNPNVWKQSVNKGETLRPITSARGFPAVPWQDARPKNSSKAAEPITQIVQTLTGSGRINGAARED